jgi:hypothetical protein
MIKNKLTFFLLLFSCVITTAFSEMKTDED